MEAVIWFIGIALPVAAMIFLFGWLVGFNYSSDMSNWGTGFDDGWKAHKELTEEIKERGDNNGLD